MKSVEVRSSIAVIGTIFMKRAKRPPARPVKKPEMMKATSLYKMMLYPTARERLGLSRMARRTRPKGEWMIRQIRTKETMKITQTKRKNSVLLRMGISSPGKNHWEVFYQPKGFSIGIVWY